MHLVQIVAFGVGEILAANDSGGILLTEAGDSLAVFIYIAQEKTSQWYKPQWQNRTRPTHNYKITIIV